MRLFVPFPDKEIKFKRGDGNWVTVTCGTSRFRIAGLPQEDFPAIAEPKGKAVKIDPVVLSKLITRTVFSISTEDSKYTLSGALMVIKPGAITMVATDGHRLAHIEKTEAFEDVSEEIRVLVPKKAMGELVKMISEGGETEKIDFSRDDNHLFFDMGKRLLVARMLTGQFPNFEAVLPRNNDRIVTIDREEITAAIRRVAILSDERSRTVRLSLGKGTLEVTASHSDLGEAHETLEVNYSKEELQVGFNYQYLLDFLTTADEAQINFEFKDSESAAQLRACVRDRLQLPICCDANADLDPNILLVVNIRPQNFLLDKATFLSESGRQFDKIEARHFTGGRRRVTLYFSKL
jgi:DNA polymerase-3 subunit beta